MREPVVSRTFHGEIAKCLFVKKEDNEPYFMDVRLPRVYSDKKRNKILENKYSSDPELSFAKVVSSMPVDFAIEQDEDYFIENGREIPVKNI